MTKPNLLPKHSDKCDQTSGESKSLMPEILGFEHLVVSPTTHDPELNKVICAGTTIPDGSETPPPYGIPRGSTLLISGPPGAGKSTFAFALARSLMVKKKCDKFVSNERMLYFISSEIDPERLKKMFGQFGWLPPSTDPQLGTLFQTQDADRPKNLYHIFPTLEIDRPVPTPEELVNDVINRIGKTLALGESQAPRQDIIVIIDSITALLKGCLTQGDERRQSHEILQRLKAIFGDRLVLTMLLAEQESGEGACAPPSTVEDYLAEIVFRLSHKVLPLGRRLRQLEILKSQGVNLMPGTHSWSIITPRTYNEHLRHKKLQEEASEKGQLDGQNTQWASIAIFSRPRLLYPAQKNSTTKKDELFTGTPGLDDLLLGETEKWLKPTDDKQPTSKALGLLESSTTIVAGPMGCGKTTMCLQFLLAPVEECVAAIHTDWHELMEKSEADTSNELKEYLESHFSSVGNSMLVCLGTEAASTRGSVIDRVIRRHLPKAAPSKAKDCLREIIETKIHVLDFTQSHFDFNQLVYHLEWGLSYLKPKLIAFDGLSEWLTTIERSEAAKMLEAIGVVVANWPQNAVERPTVFMTYEMSTADDPLAPQTIGIHASNIVALKQVNIQDEIRRVVYVLKTPGDKHEKSVRELTMINDQLRVISGLDSFNGLMGGEIKPAEVLLQMFRENNAERVFNDYLKARLGKLCSLSFKALDYTRSEIGRTLSDTRSQTRFPPADLKILSVDEWWLGEERKQPGLSPLLNLVDIWPELRRDSHDIGPCWDDYWIFELEKTGPKPKTESDKNIRYAVPGYMDYGMFCINLRVLNENKEIQKCLGLPEGDEYCLKQEENQTTHPTPKQSEWYSSIWEKLLTKVPRRWARPNYQNNQIHWFERPNTSLPLAESTIVDLMALCKKSADSNTVQRGFAFDMATRETCVCFFIELAWAFGASETFLNCNDKAKNETKRDQESCHAAILFLQFLVLEGLMPPRSTVDTTRNSLFSRHFYSTLQSVSDMDRREAGGIMDHRAGKEARGFQRPPYHPSNLLPLPFFPIGALSPEKENLNLCDDARIRFMRLLERMEKCRDYDFKSYSETWSTFFNVPLDETSNFKVFKATLFTASEELIKVLTKYREPKGNKPDVNSCSFQDVLELAYMHLMRIKLLCGNRVKWSLHKIALSQERLKLEVDCDSTATSIPTGYGCTGSWMYGVARATRSPSLARDMLAEITSLESAQKRASLGAGIPARRDFFSFHGVEKVPGIEHFSWTQLYQTCASRARRRGRVLAPDSENVAGIYQTIHETLLASFSEASLARHAYENEDTSRVINDANDRAYHAFNHIWIAATRKSPVTGARNV